MWERLNSDLTQSLKQVRGTVEKKLEEMGNIIYQYGTECFGVLQSKVAKQAPIQPVSRRQQEIKRLVQKRRQLKKIWKKASEVEKEGLSTLQADLKTRLASLRSADNLWIRRRKKQEQGSTKTPSNS